MLYLFTANGSEIDPNSWRAMSGTMYEINGSNTFHFSSSFYYRCSTALKDLKKIDEDFQSCTQLTVKVTLYAVNRVLECEF